MSVSWMAARGRAECLAYPLPRLPATRKRGGWYLSGPRRRAGRIPSQETTMQRKASAVWKGGLKDGKGTVSSASGVLKNTPYSFTTRFEDAPGTNPEELIAAAH